MGKSRRSAIRDQDLDESGVPQFGHNFRIVPPQKGPVF
jgi:hypothetical protein